MIDERDIIAILRSAERCESFYLELKTSERTIVVRAGTAARAAPLEEEGRARASRVARPAAAQLSGATATLPEEAPPGEDDVDGEVVRAAVNGTFFSSPKPGAAPFCVPGGDVNEGSTVGLIEIMKLFNQVVAHGPGVFDRYLVNDGASVQMGDPVARFKVRGA